MKIECTIKRPNGTVVPVGSSTYHFRPERPDVSGMNLAPHVCNVEDPAHVKAFLSAEGYEVFVDDVADAETATVGTVQFATDTAPAATAPPLASSTAPIAPQPAAQSGADSGETTDNPNPPLAQQSTETVAAEVTETDATASSTDGTDPGETDSTSQAGPVDLEDMTDDELRERHQLVLGRAPHHRAKRETMIAAIESAPL